MIERQSLHLLNGSIVFRIVDNFRDVLDFLEDLSEWYVTVKLEDIVTIFIH